MITLSNNTKGLALLHQVKEIYGKVNTSDSLLETVLYWGINCIAEIAPSLYSKNGNIALLRSGKQVLQLLRIDYDISVR